MNKELQRFKQQDFNEQLDVTIHSGAIIAVDNIEVNTPREKALANIILRLNASTFVLQNDIIKLKELLPK